MPNSLRLRYLLPYSFVLGVLILLLGSITEAQATHIRAGDITAQRDTTPNPDPRRFFFTMVMYTNDQSPADDPQVTISMGDGRTIVVNRLSVTPVGNNTDREEYKWTYTYAAAGTYTVSWNGIYRNGGIVNIAPPSDQVSFFISTTITINPLRGFNSTPVLTVAPIDLAAVGRKWVHNPGAFDPDGDSLAFKLRVPQHIGGGGNITNVPGYVFPERVSNCQNSTASGGSVFVIDPRTGQLTWDAPCLKGEYNVAFVVEEWRVAPGGGAALLSQVVRDMQIIVKESDNRPPVLVPKDTCIIAGTTLNTVISATDPDGDLIDLTAPGTGGIFPPATFQQTVRVAGRAAGTFNWPTQCTDVREQPYQVIFRAEDVRPPLPDRATGRLVDLQPYRIKVVGPPPQNLAVTAEDRTATVTWDKYICQNASTIRIYRREGRANFVPDKCQTGVPPETGYVLVGEVPKDQTSFTDNNKGAGLTAGVSYCYIIYAEFPLPGGGKSIASQEACLQIDQDIPYLTNVTVDRTSTTAGQITVKWTKPNKLDVQKEPYRYRLYRKEGQGAGGTFTLVKNTTNLNDTTFVDTGLNTEELAYRYRLEFYRSAQRGGNADVLRDSTEASSVRLQVDAAPNDEKAFVLNWTYSVPWKNEVFRHRIYRKLENELRYVLIDSVTATAASGTYTDRGTFGNKELQRGLTYCYYVQTVGTYQVEGVPEPLLNNSQEMCMMLPKVVCAPELSIDPLDCNQFLNNPTEPPYQNVLTWVPQVTGDCTDQIEFYTVYFRPTMEGEYVKLGTTTETTFTHSGLQSFAGCYVVTATDTAGRESAFSNEVCKDNCISFMLPNIITPNGDGKNDVFRPDRKSKFIKSMKFSVFNRWGVKVYDKSATEGGDALYINWPGVGNDGNQLTDGIYYYEAEVEFYTIDPSKARAKYKGWVEIVR
ncbi:gliding motility-associated C-terminal domain-containing protein [Pontibacter ruber]|uniref:Gliding motility-associated C-terminal domain-containing protein n=1 Tax=Pontibacter ruber TaxID=1343895 RepID=A0ABW5CTA4_9BACT|nr:gliding motility-associated C-terminal domain-containing protein [Pontibacter ruber]